MKYCSVPFCFNSKHKEDCRTKTFFSLPLKKPDISKVWIRNMNIEGFTPTAKYIVCSDHFETNSYTLCPFTKRRKLKPDAVPVIFKIPKNVSKFGCSSVTDKVDMDQDGTKPKKETAMVFKCCVPQCRGNYENGLQVSVFSFPSDEETKQVWVSLIRRENFVATKSSKVCELHFEPSQIVREASGFDPKTGRTITAPLSIPRLRKGAIPTLSMPPEGTLFKSRYYSPKVTNKDGKNQPEKTAVSEEANKSDENQLAKLLQIDSKTDPPAVDDPSIVIKEEPIEPTDISSPPVIENRKFWHLPSSPMLLAEDLASSSSSSPSTSLSPSTISHPFVENASPVAKPDSTNVIETPVTHVSNKPSKKRKMDDVKPNSSSSSPLVMKAKKRCLNKPPSPSKKNSSPHPPAVTSNKSAGRSISPTEDAENATREMLQFLVNDSENRSSERPGDLFDVFSDFIADKLREMSSENCAYALRAILDIVFKASVVHQVSKVDSVVPSPVSGSSTSHQD